MNYKSNTLNTVQLENTTIFLSTLAFDQVGEIQYSVSSDTGLSIHDLKNKYTDHTSTDLVISVLISHWLKCVVGHTRDNGNSEHGKKICPVASKIAPKIALKYNAELAIIVTCEITKTISHARLISFSTAKESSTRSTCMQQPSPYSQHCYVST